MLIDIIRYLIISLSNIKINTNWESYNIKYQKKSINWVFAKWVFTDHSDIYDSTISTPLPPEPLTFTPAPISYLILSDLTTKNPFCFYSRYIMMYLKMIKNLVISEAKYLVTLHHDLFFYILVIRNFCNKKKL